MEFESLAVAKCEAVKTAGALIFDDAGDFWERGQWNMTVTDDRGLTLFTLHFMGVDSAAKRAPTPDRR